MSGPHIANRSAGRFSCTCGFTDPTCCPHERRAHVNIQRQWPLWLWGVVVFNPAPGIVAERIDGWTLRHSVAVHHARQALAALGVPDEEPPDAKRRYGASS